MTWPGGPVHRIGSGKGGHAAVTGGRVPCCRRRSVCRLCSLPVAQPSARDGRRRRVFSVPGSPSRGRICRALGCRWAYHSGARAVSPPGVAHWATATVVALLFGLRYDPAARLPSWRCFLSFGPRRTRGPLSVACGAAEHAEVQPVGRMTVALGGANARHSAASQPCAAARCRTKVRMFGAKPRTDAERPIGAPGRCSTAHSSPILRRLLPQRPDQQPRPAERECEHHHPAEDAHHSGSTAPRPPGHGPKG